MISRSYRIQFSNNKKWLQLLLHLNEVMRIVFTKLFLWLFTSLEVSSDIS